jgi:hypothetical protein
VPLEVADHRADVDRRIVEDECADGLRETVPTDIDGDIANVSANTEDVQQESHLPTRPGPELHDIAGPDAAHHVRGDVPEDDLLDPGEVVLRKVRDALEEDGTGMVVEVLGGK